MEYTRWVKLENGQIVSGPSDYRPDETYMEYREVLNLQPPYRKVSVQIDVIDGCCVKTVTSIPDYASSREAEYPSLGDQLDMLWHAMKDGVLPRVEPFYSQIETVKAQYPKPPTT